MTQSRQSVCNRVCSCGFNNDGTRRCVVALVDPGRHPRPDIEAIHIKLTAAAYAVADAQELARECVPRLDHTTWTALHYISDQITRVKRYLDQEPTRVGL